MCEAVAPLLIPHRGRIVNVSSTWVLSDVWLFSKEKLSGRGLQWQRQQHAGC